MENKEALEYLKNHNKYYEPVNREAFRVIEASLQELEELKKIMGTPIQDIMKRLKILEILKKNIEIVDTDFVDEDGDDIFKIQLKPLNSSNQRIIEEWLGNDK